jgi:hypothetical protein
MTVSTTARDSYDTVYRFYNFHTGTHVYTAPADERATVQNTLSDWYHDEGVAFYVPTSSGVDGILSP